MAWAAPQQGPGEAAAPHRVLGARLCHQRLQEQAVALCGCPLMALWGTDRCGTNAAVLRG